MTSKYNDSIKPNLDFDNQREVEKDDDLLLGAAIRFWIDRNGMLDLSTPSNEIIKYYEENRGKNNS